jgi:RimJ/RimL family protein N-acetyltransferase
MTYAKDVLKLNTIVAITTKDNVASINLLKKIGLGFKEFVNLPGDEDELMLFECKL